MKTLFRTLKKINIIKNASIYTISSILNSAIPFIFLPLLTTHLTPKDFGIVSSFQVLIGLISPFVGLGIDGAIEREYFKKTHKSFAIYLSNCLYIILTTSFFVGLIFYFFSSFFSELFVFPSNWFFTIIIVALGQFINIIILMLWQINEKAVLYGTYQILLTILNTTFSLFFIISLNLNWQGRVLAQTFIAGISIIFGFVLFWKKNLLKFKFQKSVVFSVFAFGLPLIPHAIGGWLTTWIDRIILGKLINISEVGIYTVAFQLVQIIAIIQLAVNTAFIPWLFKNLENGTYIIKLKIVKFSYFFIILIFIFSLLFSLIAPYFIYYFIGKDFRSAIKYIFLLSIAQSIRSIYFMTCNYIFYSGKTIYIGISTFITAIIHFSASYLFVSKFGAIGAAYGTVASSITSSLLTFFFASKLYNMPWNLKNSKTII
jgi:O-antigen/teichoic acid export membrane protein